MKMKTKPITTTVKIRESHTGVVRTFDISDIRKIGHTYAMDILSDATVEEQGIDMAGSVLYAQHEDRSQSLFIYNAIITFSGEPHKVNLVDDLGNRIEYSTQEIESIRNCQAKDIMSRSDCKKNCTDICESVLQIQFKDGTKNTLNSDWTINFKTLGKFKDEKEGTL